MRKSDLDASLNIMDQLISIFPIKARYVYIPEGGIRCSCLSKILKYKPISMRIRYSIMPAKFEFLA